MRKTGLLLLLFPLLASCGVVHSVTGEKRYTIASPAMEPTLPLDSKITATVVKPGSYQPVDGDIVVFKAPAEWDPDKTGTARIYRVVAIGGETIACCDAGRIQRNGKPIDEPYLKVPGVNEPFPGVTLPAGSLFVLGDNRAHSADSTVHGPVLADTVIGVVKTD
ncbi:signal peptidase I [Actinoplanes sp. NPDC026619]|uniref:signal peptidase I n=1 Tax=Actinoplanes sp. NPDC026619 TaxID=3155798 RepID=UPI0033FB11D1